MTPDILALAIALVGPVIGVLGLLAVVGLVVLGLSEAVAEG